MTMKNEISRIIAMLQEGKISAEEAEQLISAVKEPETNDTDKGTTKSFLGKMLKVRVSAEEKDNVVVNIPIKIVKIALKMGHGIAWSIPEAKAYVEDIDLDLIMH